MNVRLAAGIFLALFGFVLFESAFLISSEAISPLITQTVGGVLSLLGLILSFNGLLLNQRRRIDSLHVKISEDVNREVQTLQEKINAELKGDLNSLTRRIDNDYKLLTEKIGEIDENLKRLRTAVLKDSSFNHCKFCNAELDLNSSFCPDCGRAQN